MSQRITKKKEINAKKSIAFGRHVKRAKLELTNSLLL